MVRPLRYIFSLGFVPPRWRIACFAALGLLGGVGLAVARISRAGSYLSDKPETCINCHVMNVQYATWQRSSHAGVATCNDCHVPHDNVLHHYAFKAKDGMRHATIFTLRGEPQVIRMSKAAVPVVEANCRRCHGNVVDEVHLKEYQSGDLRCWDCHRDVPHGRGRSLSSVHSPLNPQLPDSVLGDDSPRIGGRAPRPR